MRSRPLLGFTSETFRRRVVTYALLHRKAIAILFLPVAMNLYF